MLVVTPNTCIDVTTWLPLLAPGSVSRATRTEVTAGGKGVNVCRTLRALGAVPRLIGLSAVSDPRLEALLEAEECDFTPVPHHGQTRLALILLEGSGRVTVTAQNHEVEVVAESLPPASGFYVSQRNLNDGSVEGLRHVTKPIETVQYHPEGAPGPLDALAVFDRFLEACRVRA